MNFATILNKQISGNRLATGTLRNSLLPAIDDFAALFGVGMQDEGFEETEATRAEQQVRNRQRIAARFSTSADVGAILDFSDDYDDGQEELDEQQAVEQLRRRVTPHKRAAGSRDEEQPTASPAPKKKRAR